MSEVSAYQTGTANSQEATSAGAGITSTWWGWHREAHNGWHQIGTQWCNTSTNTFVTARDASLDQPASRARVMPRLTIRDNSSEGVHQVSLHGWCTGQTCERGRGSSQAGANTAAGIRSSTTAGITAKSVLLSSLFPRAGAGIASAGQAGDAYTPESNRKPVPRAIAPRGCWC